MITEFLRGVSECMSDRMHDLLSRMLQPDHYNRPTAVECLQFLGACLSSHRTTPVYTYMVDKSVMGTALRFWATSTQKWQFSTGYVVGASQVRV